MLSVPTVQVFHENLSQLCHELHDKLRTSEHPAVDQKVELAVKALEELLLAQRFTPAQEKTLLKIDTISQHVPLTQEAYAYYEKDVAKTIAQGIIEQRDQSLILSHSNVKRKYYQAVKEAHFTNMKAHTNVLAIGNGPLPISPIVYATKTGARITIVETEARDQNEAVQTITAMGLSKKINFIGTQQINTHAKKADIVLLSGSITNKRKILEELVNVVNPGTVMLCRTATGLRSLLREHVSLARLPEYTKIGMIHPSKNGIESTAVLLR
ncbi:MAG: hypothetical protein FJY86_01335 [Candidatus Diapherotrites archaeon]|uniref:Nicotianamine synthase n=1 Tax=Candidatus Iainarchaeum sp. TaxID=3101447 RepID=A0A8T4CAI6_9ARCH|nr:hypothetical protein [Candidatus Diapherotrites archaeon]